MASRQPQDRVRDAVFAVVRRIPPGCVASYGQVADMVDDFRVTARQVGRILATCPDGIPWYRVPGSDGQLPIAKRSPVLAALQRELLTAEGVAFLESGRIDMARFRWLED